MRRPLLLLLLALAGMFLLASCGRPEVETIMDRARDAALQGRLQDAIDDTERCLRHVPKLADAQILHGYCLFLNASRESVRSQAIYNLHKATRAFPERYDAWLFYGWVLLESGDSRNAIPPLQEALRLLPPGSPHRGKIQMLLGKCYLQNNLQSQALQILQPLRIREPYRSAPELYNALGMLAMMRQNPQMGATFFQEGLARCPRNEVLLQNLAIAYDLYLNDVPRAKRAYIQCLQVKQKGGQDPEGCQRIVDRLRKLTRRQ
ncbi:MAG: tetratricopeptide repeat protein [Oligosphaeraceae bacterium]